MQFVTISKTKGQIINIVNDLVSERLSAAEAKLNAAAMILDGVSLEELTNFSVPLTGNQTQDQLRDGVLLGYKDGKLVEENELNGGEF
jgi:hypothetical protein